MDNPSELTLRDIFAGQALQGILASYSTIERMRVAAEGWKKSGEKTFEKYLSVMAYEQADNMLLVRSKNAR